MTFQAVAPVKHAKTGSTQGRNKKGQENLRQGKDSWKKVFTRNRTWNKVLSGDGLRLAQL